MGHAIGGGFLEATTKEAAMKEGYADAEDFAWRNGDEYEGSTTYHGDFRFYNKIFDTEEEAEEFFDSLGAYCDGVVMVKEATKGARNRYSKTMTRLREKQQNIVEKALESFKERTSATVGCKKCGTRITAEEAIRRNLYCPSCRNWLVPDSVKQKMQKIEEAMEQAKDQLRKDTAETGKPRYWAKYEVHC